MRHLSLMVIVGAAVLAGCGGGDDKVAATPPAATATAPATAPAATATATAPEPTATAPAATETATATATATAEKTPEATATPAATKAPEKKNTAPQLDTVQITTKTSPIACMATLRKPHRRAPNEWVGEDKPTGEDVLVTGPYKSEPEANDSADSQTPIASAEAGGRWVVTAPVLAHIDKTVHRVAGCLGKR